MKKLMVIAMFLGLAIGASAQRGHISGGYHGGGFAVRPRVSVGLGFYSPFGLYGAYGYNPYWGFPYGGYGAFSPYSRYGYATNSRLERKVQNIKSDYADRIYSVRHDDSLSGKQRRQTVRSLKRQEKKDIHDLVVNYHRQRSGSTPQGSNEPQPSTDQPSGNQ